MGDWKQGNGLTCIYLYICVLCRYFDNLSCTRCAKCVCVLVLFWWCFPQSLKLCSCHVFIYVFIHSLCSKKNDVQVRSEARANDLIKEEYRKLGPIKWGFVYVFKSNAVQNNEIHFLPQGILLILLLRALNPALQKDRSLSFFFFLPSFSSHEIPSFSLAGLFCSKKGKSLNVHLSWPPLSILMYIVRPLIIILLHGLLLPFLLQVRLRPGHWCDHRIYIVLLPLPKTLSELVVRPQRSVSPYITQLSWE